MIICTLDSQFLKVITLAGFAPCQNGAVRQGKRLVLLLMIRRELQRVTIIIVRNKLAQCFLVVDDMINIWKCVATVDIARLIKGKNSWALEPERQICGYLFCQ